MSNVSVNFQKTAGRIKPMHAVNNGPIKADKVEQTCGNFDDFAAAKIPFARTHDASFFPGYGGEHSVDVAAIFPDFTKNPYDEDSYDFTLTDIYLQTISDAGTEPFFRFGNKIEHWVKKYGTKVPSDFHKWAVVCEHIIRHCNCGWANGLKLGIRYWEIWNEADGVKANGDQPNWSGTPEEYYELYSITAKHLKQRFPELKIGGPSVSSFENSAWLDGFFKRLTANGERVPLDFFSWHIYMSDPEHISKYADVAKTYLDKYGYADTESFLTEYNYLENFTDRFVSSIENIIGVKGAAFTAAAFAVGQRSPVDMLMYYDARPCVFNGMFDYYTLRSIKGYYPFLMFSKLYELGDSAECASDDGDVYTVAAFSGGRRAVMVTDYHSRLDEITADKEVSLDLGSGSDGEWTMRTVDAERTMEESKVSVTDGRVRVIMRQNSFILLENV